MEPKEVANPFVFCLTVFGWSNTCILNAFFGPTGSYPLYGSKKAQKYGKNVKILIYRKYHKMIYMRLRVN